MTRATMANVAEMAGVSTATVRRVIYEDGYVKTSTRDAVLDAVRKTSYRPNLFARGLRTHRSHVLAFVSENELNPFFMKVAKEVQSQALARGYTVLMLNHNGSAAVENAGVEQFIDQRVAAVIFCAAASPDTVKRVAAAGIRVVQVEREVARLGHTALVGARRGIRQAVDHLAELGHSRIAYVGGAPIPNRSEIPIEETNESLRLAAFRETMSDHGLDLPAAFVKLGGYYDKSTFSPLDGRKMMEALLAEKPKPTAVIVGSDFIAAGALQATHGAGLRVPDDISIIGYDDSMANILTPPLTSIAQPMEELGRFAVVTSISPEPDVEAGQTVFDTHLVIRSSTAAPPRRR